MIADAMRMIALGGMTYFLISSAAYDLPYSVLDHGLSCPKLDGSCRDVQ